MRQAEVAGHVTVAEGDEGGGTVRVTRWALVATATPVSASTPTPTQEGRVIAVEAKGLSLNYSQELYLDEEKFAREYDAYSADKARYLEDIVEGFSEKFLKSAWFACP